MKKTHVLNLSITGRHCHNLQLTLCFCVILGDGTSVGSSAGASARTSVGTRKWYIFSLMSIILIYHKILQKSPLKYENTHMYIWKKCKIMS
jgi:hypothetical protein